jgi:hypothetical protein
VGKSGPVKSVTNHDEAQVIALNVLTFLASDDDRLVGFLRMTGVDPATLRTSAADPAFLAGVLHYVVQNEAMLLEFADAQQVDPNLPRLALSILDPSSGSRSGG